MAALNFLIKENELHFGGDNSDVVALSKNLHLEAVSGVQDVNVVGSQPPLKQLIK
jgi:hypothetical protein